MKKRRKRSGQASVVYFLRCDSTRMIKIGVARVGALSARISGLRVAHASTLRLLGTIPGTATIEAALHLAFRASRVRGEWFRETAELRQFVTDFVAAPERAQTGAERVPLCRAWHVPIRHLAVIAGVSLQAVRGEIASGHVPGVADRMAETIPRGAALKWLRARPAYDVLAAIAERGAEEQQRASGRAETMQKQWAARAAPTRRFDAMDARRREQQG